MTMDSDEIAAVGISVVVFGLWGAAVVGWIMNVIAVAHSIERRSPAFSSCAASESWPRHSAQFWGVFDGFQ